MRSSVASATTSTATAVGAGSTSDISPMGAPRPNNRCHEARGRASATPLAHQPAGRLGGRLLVEGARLQRGSAARRRRNCRRPLARGEGFPRRRRAPPSGARSAVGIGLRECSRRLILVSWRGGHNPSIKSQEFSAMDRQQPEDTTTGFKTSTVWHRQLEGGGTVKDIVSTLQDYLDPLTPADLARLPEHCRAVRVKGDDDLEYWTYKLSRDHPAHTGARFHPALLEEVFNHFLHASERVSQIHRAVRKAEHSRAR